MDSKKTSAVSIPFAAGATGDESWMLEGEVHQAESGADAIAIICHPHPEFGGTMHNNVVSALFDGLVDSMATARFNFSGVGRSEGHHQGGTGEIEQVRAAVEFFTTEFVETRGLPSWKAVSVIGYSFGAAMAAPAVLGDSRVASFVSIAFPVAMFPKHARDAREQYSEGGQKVLFLIGDRDEFTTLETHAAHVKRMNGAVHVVVDGANHFFGGKEGDVVRLVNDFLLPR